MSQRDRDRLAVLKQVEQGLVGARRGAELLDLTPRHFRRLRRRWERAGDAIVIHGLRGRRSNRAKAVQMRERALKRAREPVFEGFGPTLLAEHLSRDPRIGELKAVTLRKWMIEEGVWKPRRRRARHRKARPRRAAFGELIQWDSSEHAWFEDRAAGRFVLIQMHDDATNRLMMARFVPRDTGAANRQIAIDYLRRHGRPVAFYTDKAGHFGQWTRPVSQVPLEERDTKRTESIICRALEELNVELILAHSPQAKGRVERNFGTSQDRLVKELRVADISTLEDANHYLDEVYIPFWNERFAVEPAESRNAHRRLSKRPDLDALFAETLTRSVGNDFTIQYSSRRWQISKHQARGIRPRHKITVELRIDGSTRFRFKKRYLDLEPVAQLPKLGPQNHRPPRTKKTPATDNTSKLHPTPPKPGPDHPWRRHGKLIANSRAIARYRATAAASRPSPSTPSMEGAS
ncbi:MAG: ISNCY family transposase [Gemmatimonadetes bacterium]|nr:ISNCY family transposase [Gemmatimonadota bacterium]